MPLIVTVDKDGHITLDNKPVSIDEASTLIQKHMADNANAAVVLQADKGTAHGQVVAVMDMLKSAGVSGWPLRPSRKGEVHGQPYFLGKRPMADPWSFTPWSSACSCAF